MDSVVKHVWGYNITTKYELRNCKMATNSRSTFSLTILGLFADPEQLSLSIWEEKKYWIAKFLPNKRMQKITMPNLVLSSLSAFDASPDISC